MLQDNSLLKYFAKVLAFQLRQKQSFLMAGPRQAKNDFNFFNHKSKTFKKNKRRGL